MCKKFKSEDSIEREKILEKFEAVCAMFALDLIGVKVFRYSDETAEAVASGEKLLKAVSYTHLDVYKRQDLDIGVEYQT